MDAVIANILEKGYATTGAILIAIGWALIALWHKYEAHLKSSITQNANENKETLNEIKRSISDSNQHISKIGVILNDYQTKIADVEHEANSLKIKSESSSEDIAYIVKEIECIKEVLETIRLAIIMDDKSKLR